MPVTAQHTWLRPSMETANLDLIEDNTALGLGGDNYSRFSGVALATNVGGTPQVFGNLGQEKAELNAPTELVIRGTDAADVGIPMLVTGVDGDGNFVDTYIAVLDGLNPVSIGLWWRVMRIEHVFAPTALTGGAVVYDPLNSSGGLTDPYTFQYAPAFMEGAPTVNAGRSYDGTIAIPFGYYGYTKGFKFFADKALDYAVYIQLRRWDVPGSPWQTFQSPRVSGSAQAEYTFEWRSLPPGFEVRALVARLSGSQGATVTMDFQLTMVKVDAANA